MKRMVKKEAEKLEINSELSQYGEPLESPSAICTRVCALQHLHKWVNVSCVTQDSKTKILRRGFHNMQKLSGMSG